MPKMQTDFQKQWGCFGVLEVDRKNEVTCVLLYRWNPWGNDGLIKIANNELID